MNWMEKAVFPWEPDKRVRRSEVVLQFIRKRTMQQLFISATAVATGQRRLAAL